MSEAAISTATAPRARAVRDCIGIFTNNTLAPSRCEFCGAEFRLEEFIFQTTKGEDVCPRCAKEAAPELWVWYENATRAEAEREMREQKLRAELLEEASRKPVRELIQYDGWHEEDGGDTVHPDADGHALTRGRTKELRRSPWPVRVHVMPDAPRDLVLALLAKIRSWIEQEWPVPDPPTDNELPF